jgi:hypothetical protein
MTRSVALAGFALVALAACVRPPSSAPPPQPAGTAATTPANTQPPSDGGATPPKETRQDFDAVPIGTLPKDWKIGETNPDGPAAVWRVTPEGGAHSGRLVLLLAEKRPAADGTFNLCWTESLRMKDGAVEVALQARTGQGDQGGGVIWHAQDARNYYVCRVNPLEQNLRAYSVKNSVRTQLASATVAVDAHKWHTLHVEHTGAHITCSLDSVKLLEFDDATFSSEGGVGVWTKADAATAFDDFVVTRR